MPAITVEQLEDAILHLSADDYHRFCDWFLELDHNRWDQQIEKDADAGRLDSLANEALREFREGQCRRI